ncbi:MAG: tetratricopeptide repeat protein [Acidobacteriota bacterium]
MTFEDPYFEAMSARREGLGPLLAQALDAFARGDFETALGHYLAALELDPASAAALSGAAGSLRKSGQMQRASDLLAGLLEADPGNRLARLELATTQIETGQLEAAIAGFGSLIERDPDFDKAHFGLGIAQGRAGRWPLAAESFRRTLELSPKDQNARFHLALALIQQGSLDAAVATLERTVREAPSFLRARQRLGDLLFSSQRLPEAEEQFRAVAAMEAEAPPQERALAYYQLGRLQMARDEIPGATADFERAVALFPELWQAHIALGHRYRSAARFIDAASSFSSAAAINPEHVAARIFEAQALIAGGEYARARARLEQGLADLPRAAQLGYALAHLLSSAPDAAVRDGARALKLATSLDRALPSPAHGEAVAMALAELGRFEEAAERQQRLIDSALEARKSPIPRPDAPGPEDLARLEENLRGYQNRQPVRLGGASSS